jgi:ADP-L-glycero-D-manno-heptose 6-epimerase
MIIVTGAAGFIASAFIGFLNQNNFFDIIAVDDFSTPIRNENLIGKKITAKVERSKFLEWLDENHKLTQAIVHLGARTDTAEFDIELLDALNLNYTKSVWESSCKYGLPLIYASSAATYGDGELGYEDNHQIIKDLQPLNPYGKSKNDFDLWAINQETQPYFWAGLKFFNVYGPNEYNKGRMASVVFHAFNQIKATGGMKLFKSHHPDYTDGGQMRDFVYVKDVCNVIFWLLNHRNPSSNGIYNLGSGNAETFLELTQNTFLAMGIEPKIEFIDTPSDIRDKYQYYTKANMSKLRNIGYPFPFTSLKDGIFDYVQNYLEDKNRI